MKTALFIEDGKKGLLARQLHGYCLIFLVEHNSDTTM
jgi:hypothetical protein